jgi:urea carboxylase-associated protein 2
MSDTSTPRGAQQHARALAQAQAARVRAKPTIPAWEAADLPDGVERALLLWDETLEAGGYASRVLERGSRLRLVNLEGDACLQLLLFNADHPAERLNVADTVKVQWQAYLGQGSLLLSDMGRVLASIVRDDCGRHDVFCGASTVRSNQLRYGASAAAGPHAGGRERLLLGLARHGLERRDLGPNLNLFKRVAIGTDGGLAFDETPGRPGEQVELRAEMRVLAVLANTPHVLDPSPAYRSGAARILAWRGALTPDADPIRRSSPERLRAFQNVEDYYRS